MDLEYFSLNLLYPGIIWSFLGKWDTSSNTFEVGLKRNTFVHYIKTIVHSKICSFSKLWELTVRHKFIILDLRQSYKLKSLWFRISLLYPYYQGIRRIRIGIPGNSKYEKEFLGILRNTLGTLILFPWLQGIRIHQRYCTQFRAPVHNGLIYLKWWPKKMKLKSELNP